jgi:hypothetical protein
VHAVIAEIFAHRAAGIRGQILHRRRVGGGGRHHDAVFHHILLFQRPHQLRHRGALLADRHIDAVQLLALVAALVDLFLVDDGVHDQRGLAGLPVADDQLALAAADRHQHVDRLDAGLHRFGHGLPRDDPRRLGLDQPALLENHRPLVVDRVAQPVHHAAQQRLAHRHVHDVTGAVHRIALADLPVIAENHHADIVELQIQHHALHAGAGKFHQLALHGVAQAKNPGNAVADAQHLAGLGHVRGRVEIRDLAFQNLRNFGGANLHVRRLPSEHRLGAQGAI